MREMDENPGRRQQQQQTGNGGGVGAGGTPTIKNVLELKSKYEAPTADEVPTCMYRGRRACTTVTLSISDNVPIKEDCHKIQTGTMQLSFDGAFAEFCTFCGEDLRTL